MWLHRRGVGSLAGRIKYSGGEKFVDSFGGGKACWRLRLQRMPPGEKGAGIVAVQLVLCCRGHGDVALYVAPRAFAEQVCEFGVFFKRFARRPRYSS